MLPRGRCFIFSSKSIPESSEQSIFRINKSHEGVSPEAEFSASEDVFGIFLGYNVSAPSQQVLFNGPSAEILLPVQENLTSFEMLGVDKRSGSMLFSRRLKFGCEVESSPLIDCALDPYPSFHQFNEALADQ